jgi:hypothetical protein
MAMQKRQDRIGTAATRPHPQTRADAGPNDVIDINDVEFLRRFVTEYGKIVPRVSRVLPPPSSEIKQGVAAPATWACWHSPRGSEQLWLQKFCCCRTSRTSARPAMC